MPYFTPHKRLGICSDVTAKPQPMTLLRGLHNIGIHHIKRESDVTQGGTPLPLHDAQLGPRVQGWEKQWGVKIGHRDNLFDMILSRPDFCNDTQTADNPEGSLKKKNKVVILANMKGDE